MEFKIRAIELWVWRIGIVLLFIWCVILSQGNKQAQYMGLQNADLNLTTSKQLTEVIKNQLEDTVIINGISEDYPPKKKLADREWCPNRSCLRGTDSY